MKNERLWIRKRSEENFRDYIRRLVTGYSSVDYWNADVAIAEYAIPLLTHYRRHPCEMTKSWDHFGNPVYFSDEEWASIVDKMIWSLTVLRDCRFVGGKELKEFNKGMKLFAKYLPVMWC